MPHFPTHLSLPSKFLTAGDHFPRRRTTNLTHAVQMAKSLNGTLPFRRQHAAILRYLREICFLFRLPHTVPSPGCLLTPFLGSPSLRETRFASSTLYTVYVLYSSETHRPSFWITRSDTSPPAARVDAPPIRSECNANSFGFRPDFSTISRNARKALSLIHI